jgi:hypothetical protein
VVGAAWGSVAEVVAAIGHGGGGGYLKREADVDFILGGPKDGHRLQRLYSGSPDLYLLG